MLRALGFSLWIALVTAIPGLITLASVAGAIWIFLPGAAENFAILENRVLGLAFIAAIMLVTQSMGISLESQLTDRELLGDSAVTIPPEVAGEPTEIDPYEQYELLYFTLVSMGPEEDQNGHVERTVAQFFLSNNALLAFGAGLATTVGLTIWSAATGALTYPMLGAAVVYILGLVLFLIAVYHITRIRFRLMSQAVWMIRNRPSAG